jgi:hypothetical protein
VEGEDRGGGKGKKRRGEGREGKKDKQGLNFISGLINIIDDCLFSHLVPRRSQFIPSFNKLASVSHHSAISPTQAASHGP